MKSIPLSSILKPKIDPDSSRVERALSRLFKKISFNSPLGHKYMSRWVVCDTRINVYLHKFTGDDWAMHQHDHSSWFVSVGLYGSYVEKSLGVSTVYKAPWVRRFKAEHQHRIDVPSPPCWTLVVTGVQSKKSAFLVDGSRYAPSTYKDIWLSVVRKMRGKRVKGG